MRWSKAKRYSGLRMFSYRYVSLRAPISPDRLISILQTICLANVVASIEKPIPKATSQSRKSGLRLTRLCYRPCITFRLLSTMACAPRYLHEGCLEHATSLIHANRSQHTPNVLCELSVASGPPREARFPPAIARTLIYDSTPCVVRLSCIPVSSERSFV